MISNDLVHWPSGCGMGWTSIMIFGGTHCQSSFNFVRKSLEVSTQQLRIDKTTGEFIIADNLLTLFAKRAQILPEFSSLNLEQQPNLIEICQNFSIKGTRLVKRFKPESTIVFTFPSYSGNSRSPTNNLFCKYTWPNIRLGLLKTFLKRWKWKMIPKTDGTIF